MSLSTCSLPQDPPKGRGQERAGHAKDMPNGDSGGYGLGSGEPIWAVK